jgi:ubiquinone/menaquinone biosynthesis C-methylase UbiE
MSWEVFERAAGGYEGWYGTLSGQRADRVERNLLTWLLGYFPSARSAIEVGCGTGHFTGWLAGKGLRVAGLDRAPAMPAECRRRHRGIPVFLRDAHHLPFRDGALDLVVCVVTLEFLENPPVALLEAVRVARQGIILVVLKRRSVGGLSRRRGRQGCQPILGRARDYSLRDLRATVEKAAGERMEQIRWTSALFPACLRNLRAPVPFGEITGMAVALRSLQHCTSNEPQHGTRYCIREDGCVPTEPEDRI